MRIQLSAKRHVNTDGKFGLTFNKELYQKGISTFKEGVNLTIIITDDRTLVQNSYFHALCTHYSEYTGNSPKESKRQLKMMFLGYDEEMSYNAYNELTGQYITIKELKHTSELSFKEFSHFLSSIEEFFDSEGISYQKQFI